ncbi:TMV resistance protein N-like protein [Tanacetum coccineum]
MLRKLELRLTPNLESLNLEGCGLTELHMPDGLPKLKYLGLHNSTLESLQFGKTLDLETLNLVGCCDLKELDMSFGCRKLKSISLNNSQLKTFNLGPAPHLETLSLRGCDLVELHLPDGCLNLRHLDLCNSKLKTLDIGQLPNLEMLNLDECDELEELFMPNGCPKLKSLILNDSKLITFNTGMTPNLKSFSFDNSKLKILKIEQVPDLEALSLGGCYDLVELCMPFRCLNLKSINLSNSKLRTLDLGLTPNLERLDLKDCLNLVQINAPDGCLEKLIYLDLSGCGRFKSFLFDKQSKPLKVGSLSELHLIGESIDICPLHLDNSFPKFLFTCFYKEDPAASSFGNLEKLISIGQCVCANFESFSRSICSLNFLRKLTLEGNILEVAEDLHLLECLEELTVTNTEITQVPYSVCRLKQLKSLKLQDCQHIEELPDNFGLLKSLEELTLFNSKIYYFPLSVWWLKHLKSLKLQDCEHIEELSRDFTELKSLEKLILRGFRFSEGFPESIFELRRLKYFHLLNCTLDDLPEELGHLERLEELDITGTAISHLPLSIFHLKGLRIIGFKTTLELCGLTPVKRTSDNGDSETFCYTVV